MKLILEIELDDNRLDNDLLEQYVIDAVRQLPPVDSVRVIEEWEV